MYTGTRPLHKLIFSWRQGSYSAIVSLKGLPIIVRIKPSPVLGRKRAKGKDSVPILLFHCQGQPKGERVLQIW